MKFKLFINLNILITVFYKINAAEIHSEVCQTKSCRDSAEWILDHIDDSVDPCKDFYKFSCGKFVEKTVIPEDQTSVDTISLLSDLVQKQINETVRENIKPDDIKPYVLMKNFYSSCMNLTRIEERGLDPLLLIIKDFGGWPVLLGDKWIESEFEWTKLTYKIYNKGLRPIYFIDYSIGPDFKNNLVKVINIDQAELGLEKEYLSEGRGQKYVEEYYNYMVDIAKILGAEHETARKELEESLEFEMKLSNISQSREERSDITTLYNKMTIKDLNEQFPSIPWLEYINSILQISPNVTEDEPVVVYAPSYLSKFENLLKETPKRVQANYAIWRVIKSAISELSEVVRKREIEYLKATAGIEERRPRWKECVELVFYGISLSVNSLYVKKYFNSETKDDVTQMVNNIHLEFRNTLQEAEWMDKMTKSRAQQKLDSVRSYVAYPDELLDDKNLEKYYEKLEIQPEYFFESQLNFNRFINQKGNLKLRQSDNKKDWKDHVLVAQVNAIYSPIDNNIDLPAGILQGPFFNSKRPNYMNYGAIGYVIGYEITRGFNDEGSQFDKDGNLVDWWDTETESKYKNLKQCIIDQYSNYTVTETGQKLNGINTQGENIADNGGLKVAYRAYKKWASQHKPEPKLPGLEKYTPQQMFWITSSSLWCEKRGLEDLKQKVDTDGQSPGEFRVIGVLSNLPEFSQDFNCKLGSEMNPVHKCSVW